MPTTLGNAQEKSTYKITMAFTDEDGDAAVPTAVAWSLVDPDGTVINSREDVALSTMSSTMSVGLSGDDLQIQSTADSGIRYFVAEATYNSADLGNALPLKDHAVFTIDNLRKVT